jgi:hypothetical protein
VGVAKKIIEVNVKIIHQDCEKSLSKNKSLPTDSYLVTYILEEETKNDIVQSVSQADIFDYYYDLYKNVISIDWTDGKISPRFYGQTKPEKKKR